MKMLMLLAVTAALVAPVAAFASGAPSPASTANTLCKATQAAMGAKLFSQTYGANAFGKCVAKSAATAKVDRHSAAKTCKAQQADVELRGRSRRHDLRSVLRQRFEGQER